jgi:hypothetical protein
MYWNAHVTGSTVATYAPICRQAPAAPYKEVATAKECKTTAWVNVYDADPTVCMNLVISRADCSNLFFGHKTAGNGNCGCVKNSQHDCTATINQAGNSVASIYQISSPRLVVSGKRCSSNLWLHDYNGTVSSCLSLIRKRADCSQLYFNHNTGGDGNCGCVTDVDLNCTLSRNQAVNHKTVSIYATTPPLPTPTYKFFKWTVLGVRKQGKPVHVINFEFASRGETLTWPIAGAQVTNPRINQWQTVYRQPHRW